MSDLSNDESDDEVYQKRAYVSDDSDSDEEGETTTAEPKQRVQLTWRLETTFENVNASKAWMENAACWAKVKTYDTSQGIKERFRCNLVPWRGVQCGKALLLLYENTSERVLLYLSDNDHTHDQEQKKAKYGLNKATKDFIDPLIERANMLPSNIRSLLVTEAETNPNIQVPEKTQLYNYIAAWRKRHGQGPSLDFDELITWCEQNRNIPDDPNEAFVVAYQINIDGDDPESFPESMNIMNPKKSSRVFVSTKNLLEMASKHTLVLQADATYKLLWMGYPVLLIGISDMDKVDRSKFCFHLFSNKSI